MRPSLLVLVALAGLAGLTGLTGLTGLAHAGVYKSKVGRVSIDIPKKWQVTAADELIRAASANNEVAVFFWVVESADVKEALTKLERELYSSIQGLRWVDKPKKLKVNKLATTFVEGVGVSSRATQLDVLVNISGPTPANKGVIVLAVVDHDKLAGNKAAIQAIFQSLKPTPAERPAPAPAPRAVRTP